MKKFKFQMTGFMPLLMHADNIEGSDELQEWRRNPANKGVTVAGDDRSPGWTWQTYCYHDGENIVMPSENVMVALRQAGAQMILKKQKTFKEITQSGLLIRRSGRFALPMFYAVSRVFTNAYFVPISLI